MTDKTPPKITPAPDVGKYESPSEGLLGDVLGTADKTAAFNETVAKERRERERKRQELRAKLEERCADDAAELRARFDRNIGPVLDLLKNLPARDGKTFQLELRISDEDVGRAADIMDETRYRGPRLYALLRYDEPGKTGAPNGPAGGGKVKQPVLGIEIGPDRTLPDEKITVTRYDQVGPSFYDQGGAGPDDYVRQEAYSYTGLRRELGKFLGDVAPDRLAEIASAAKPKLPPGKRGPKIQ
jgi:hypothetical protein